MSNDTNETWEQRHERESREHKAKMARAWEKYKSRTDGKKEKDYRYGADRKQVVCGYSLVFDDGTKETEGKVVRKTTTFRFDTKGKLEHYYKQTSKKQKFFVVSGPNVGTWQTDTDDNYVLYNQNGTDWQHKEDPAPHCVLVHRSSFKDK